ncbi:MAG: restriction endonuclease [Chloroflexi bacterium]|nr:restriction endonuclease [Chloroflexota bacterium]
MEIEMDPLGSLNQIAARVPNLQLDRLNEEGAKHALVLPFLQALGYDVFDPQQVIPEFTADAPGIRSEKVDYALFHRGQPVILIECKQPSTKLSTRHQSQLFRYFGAVNAKVGILTNGIVYRFFTDLMAANKMDEDPFLEIDLLDINESAVSELRLLTRDELNLEGMIQSATNLRYLRGMHETLDRQVTDPEPEFVRWLAKHVFDGPMTGTRTEKFTELSRVAFRDVIASRANEAIRSALQQDDQPASAPVLTDESTDVDEVDHDDSEPKKNSGIETTVEEIEAYFVVKSILRTALSPERIAFRDQKSYASVLLDDNNRKPVCRLRFGAKTMQIGLFDAEKNESRHPIESLDDIYTHAETLRETALGYDN